MSHFLYKIGNFAGRHPWRVIAAWVVVAVAAVMLNGSIGGAPDESFSLPGAESQRASDAIHRQRGVEEADDPLLVRLGFAVCVVLRREWDRDAPEPR